MISSFKDITGLEVQTKEQRSSSVQMRGGDGFNLTIPISGVYIPLKYELKPLDAEVLAREDDGNPLFTCHAYGKGKVFFLGTAMEAGLANSAGVFEDKNNPFSSIYRTFGAAVIGRRLVRKDAELTHLSLSEHAWPGKKQTTLCVGINHGHEELQAILELDSSVTGVNVLHGKVEQQGDSLCITVPANNAFILELSV